MDEVMIDVEKDKMALLKRLLRVAPDIVLRDEETLGNYIKLKPWVMSLDDYFSPYYDLVEYLDVHTTILATLENLNDLRELTMGQVLEVMKLEELKRAIGEFWDEEPAKLTGELSLEDDLGITGGDFDELMVFLTRELGLTFELETVHYYRHPEAMFTRSDKKTDLCIRDLLRWMP